MPSISTKELIRFTPDNLKEREDVPVFLLKTPSLRDKIALDACLAVEGVRYPNDTEYAEAMKEGVRQQVVDEDQPMLMAYIEEWESVREEGNTPDQELAERIDHIAKVLRPFHRPLAQIEADRGGGFLAMAMLVRAEMFLMDIESVDAPKLERRSGRLTEKCQEAIEDKYGTGVLFAIGARTVVLTTPTEDEVKKLRIAGAIAARPRDFDGGPRAADGSAWEILGEWYERNPRIELPNIYFDILRLWRYAMPPPGRIVGMAAGAIPIVGHLPEPGGVLDQSIWLLEAFSILNGVESKLAPPVG